MADNVEIQGLEFQIQEDSAQAVAGLERLAATLERLKSAVSGGVSGLNTTTKQLERLNTALAGLDLNSAEKLTGLANGLRALGQIGQIRVSASIANQVTALAAALENIQWTDGDKLAALAQGLEPLTKLEKANLTSFLNQLSKLPAVIRELDQVDMEKFTRQMTQLAEAMEPLAQGMEKVSGGFSTFPSQIQRASSALNRYNSAAKSSSKGGLGLGGSLLSGAKTAGLGISLQKVAGYLEDCIVKSNAYQENLNLFTVAMGEYAGEALKYGETVSEALGIDPSVWIRNQGVFNTLFTGFGNTADRAALMSKNLTQLGYDLSSFFNISVDQAMQKLQSGISGELEPLRRLGYDLSQAKLQLTAYNLGIEKKIQNMTQAEKAELRYHAILTQVTQAQGDMARTLEVPSNQIRILKAQFEMAARAIGNIFIPALNAILPYAIAVVQVIRQIAEALASLFGFKLTEVDYSGVGELATDAGAAEEALGGAAGAAKKLKDYTAGFDELNIFSSPDAGGGVAGGAGAQGGFDFDLPEYDFLGDAMAKRVDEVKKKLEELLPLIAGIGAGLAAWEIAKKLLPQLGTMQRLLGSLMVAVGVTLLVDSIQDIIVNGLTWQNILEGAGGGALAGAGLGLMLAQSLGLTWGKGILLGAVVGLGVSLLIMAVTSEIVHGLDVGSVLLGVIGGALAGAGIGAYLGKSVTGGMIGATVGIGVSLLIMGIVSEVRDGVNFGNGFLTALGGAFAGAGIGIKIVGDVGGALLGATVGIGVTLVITGIISQVQEGVNAVGAILTVLGSVLTGAGIGFMIGGPTGAAVGAAIGLVVGIGLEFIGIQAAGKAAYEASEDFKIMENIIERSRETSQRCTEAMGNLKTNVANLDQVSSDFAAASILVDEIFAINDNANASNYELELMRVKVDVLNGMNIDGLHLSIDETTGRVIEARQEVEKLIESLQREAQMEAMKELLVQTYQDLAVAQKDAVQSLKDYDTASQALRTTSEELANCPWYDFQRHAELTAAQKEQTEAVNLAQQAYADSRTTIDELNGTIELYSGQIANMKLAEVGVGDELVSGLGNVCTSLDEVAAGMEGYGQNIAEGLRNGIDENTQEAEYKSIWQRLGDWFTGLFGIHSPSTVAYDWGSDIDAGLYNGLDAGWSDINGFFMEKTSGIKQTCSDAWDNVKAAAGEKWTNIKADLGNFWDGITGDASAKFNETRGKISEAWRGTETDTSSAWEQIGTSLGLDWDGIDKTAAEKFNTVAQSIGSVWKDLILRAKDWGKDICGSIASGISGAVSTVTSAVSNVANNIRSFLHFSEPDVGPLSDFHTYMPDMMSLMAQGIRDNEDLAVDAVYDLTRSVADTFRQVSAQGMEFPVEETVAVRYEGNGWEDRRPDRPREVSDKVAIDNEEIIAALFAVGREIVTAINEKDSNTYLDGKQMMQAVEKHQRQRGANIMAGGVMP